VVWLLFPEPAGPPDLAEMPQVSLGFTANRFLKIKVEGPAGLMDEVTVDFSNLLRVVHFEQETPPSGP
jgi:hypothetical protein